MMPYEYGYGFDPNHESDLRQLSRNLSFLAKRLARKARRRSRKKG